MFSKHEIQYRVGDCVYLRPGSGESYFIGRILSFLMVERKVKIGWFLRGSESAKHKPRLLIATMTSDINPISSIKGKCTVTHLDNIPKLDDYIKRENHFYYYQLYDRFTTRFYDVIPLSKAKTLPKDIIQKLKRYKYILVEQGKASSFLETQICSICKEWCNPDEPFLTCAMCNEYFHTTCAQFTTRIRKGYVWQCSKCHASTFRKGSLEIENPLGEISQEDNESQPNDNSSTKRVMRRTRASSSTKSDNRTPPDTKSITSVKDIPADSANANYRKTRSNDTIVEDTPVPIVDESEPEFPFFYLGEYTNALDISEITTSKGYPKARSRIGPQYQADVSDEMTSEEIKTRQRSRSKRKSQKAIPNEVIINRYDINETVFLPGKILDSELDELMLKAKPILGVSDLTSDSVDLILEALHHNEYSVNQTLAQIRLNPKDFIRESIWTEKDIAKLQMGLEKYGGSELFWIQEEYLPKKSLKDIVLYYYKNLEYPADLSTQEGSQSPIKESDELSSEDEFLPYDPNDRSKRCSNCSNTDPSLFTKDPIPGQSALCNDCRLHFLKYDYSRVISNNQVVSDKDDSSSEVSLSVNESSSSNLPNNTCVVCFSSKVSDELPLLRCIGCGLEVHSSCYGIRTNSIDVVRFSCERCKNEKNMESSADYECVLCPNNMDSKGTACIRTIENHWVHPQCAIWMPKVLFGTNSSPYLAECIGLIESGNWNNICTLCKNPKGATINCSERGCSKYFHVTCGQKHHPDLLYLRVLNNIEAGIYCLTHHKKRIKSDNAKQNTPELIRKLIQDQKVGLDMISRGKKRAFSQGLSDSCDCHLPSAKQSRTRKIPTNYNPVSYKKCHHCRIHVSPIWYTQTILDQEQLVCYLCHNKSAG
ncbi:PHD-zinc-finger like domain-containing protein [Globomyces pollinis-pini]|nr:PHD-zinc-finger like domain-containing protein [Globomyces pollinis-pini]